MVTQEGAQVYRIGVIPTCPVHQITVGGQCFPRRSEVVSGFGIETKRKEIQGAVVKLTQQQIAKIREAAKTRVIRSTRGKKVVSRVHDIRSRVYTPRPEDLPVEQYLYVHAEETNPAEVQSYETLAASPMKSKMEKAPRRSSSR